MEKKIFRKHPNCYTGETEGLGYAFVPGNKAGIVVLDLKSKRMLDDPFGIKQGVDDQRLGLLLKKGLVLDGDTKLTFGCRLSESRVRNFGVWLHVTNACNLRCPYCYIKKDGATMSLETAKTFIDKLEVTVERHGIDSLTIRFAGGEPMLRVELVKKLSQEINLRFAPKGVRVAFVLITNGTLMDSVRVSLVKEYNMRLCISLDGVKEWHNKTRSFPSGKGTFERVWSGIQLCQREGLQPMILSTITKDNLGGLEELNRLLVDSGLRFRYGVYRDVDGGYQGYKEFNLKLTEVLSRCYIYYEDAIRSGKATFNHQLADLRIDTNRHLRCCNIGHSGVSVKDNGAIFLCQSRMNKDSIGTVWDQATFLEMVQNQQVLPDAKREDVRDYSHCAQCQWALTCGGGCPVVKQDTYGTIATASPYCELFKMFIPRLVELRALSLIKTFQRKGG